MSAHTPGPWAVNPEYLTYIGESTFRKAPAAILGADGVTPIIESSEWLDLTEADARLCAAAPDLLMVARDALEMLAEEGLLCECGQVDCRTSRARTAIAKATGVQP